MSEQAFHGPELFTTEQFVRVQSLASRLYEENHVEDIPDGFGLGVSVMVQDRFNRAVQSTEYLTLSGPQPAIPDAALVIAHNWSVSGTNTDRVQAIYVLKRNEAGALLMMSDAIELADELGLQREALNRTSARIGDDLRQKQLFNRGLRGLTLQPATAAEADVLIEILVAGAQGGRPAPQVEEPKVTTELAPTEQLRLLPRTRHARDFWRRIFMRWL